MESTGIGIVTDSTAYLAQDVLQKQDISVASLLVNYENLSFREAEMVNSEYYYRLRKSMTLPTTSQPSLGELLKVYQELNHKYASLFSIHISSRLSGTVAAAEAASGMLPQQDIIVFDSFSTTMGLGFQVLEAARAVQAGRSKTEILRLLEWLRENIRVLFMVGSLEYLRRGGRIGGARALLGSFLEIKPLLHLNEGRIEVLDKVRTRPRAIKRMLEVIEQDLTGRPPGEIVALHVDALEEGNRLAECVRQKYPEHKISLFEVGPVIGSHVGPDSVGVAYYPQVPLSLFD